MRATFSAPGQIEEPYGASTVGSYALAAACHMHEYGTTSEQLAEIYDSFTITVLLTLESLGFCKKGEGGAFVSGQRTTLGGDFPMNTQGGALSYTHPGMFGIFTVIEAVRQLRGECGPRQVDNAQVAIANGTGGVLSSTGTIILGRE